MSFTVDELKTDIETILTNAGYLGQYTGLASNPVPAICILPDDIYGFNYPPQSVKVDRIEAAIFKPEHAHTLTFGSGLIERAKHKVCLKQWEQVNSATQQLTYPLRIREAALELFQQLNLRGYELEPPIYSGKNEQLGTLETYYLMVSCTDLVCIS